MDKEESDGDEESWNLQFTNTIFPSYFQQNFKVDKEEPDEDEEIYVIEPKPEPKFRHQIFRDKERVIHNNNDVIMIFVTFWSSLGLFFFLIFATEKIWPFP